MRTRQRERPISERRRRWLEQAQAVGPLGVAGIAIAVALVFVGLRLLLAADTDVSRFVVAGTTFTDRDAVDPHVHVFDSEGYDGQFYFRLAIAPGQTQPGAVNGVRFDNAVRVTRIGYPALAYVLSLGRPSRVPWALVLGNVLMVGVLAGVAGAFAVRHEQMAMTGLLVAASSGLVMALSRDLNEVTMVAALVVGALMIDRRSYVLAGLAWSLAALTHEQALIIIAGYALARVVAVVRRRDTAGRPELAWVVPIVLFAAWQAGRAMSTDGVPVLVSGHANVGLPFFGVLPQLAGWITGDVARQELMVLPELALLVATVVVAARSCRSLAAEDRWLAWSLVCSVVLACCLSKNVWEGPAELRQVVVVPTLSWLVIIAVRRPPPAWLVGGTAVVWCGVAALRLVAI